MTSSPTTLAPARGAHWDGRATTFTLWSGVADRVELCLLDGVGGQHHLDLPRDDDPGLWSVRVEGVGPGQRYGYRVHGPWDPARGLGCNPRKLLVDPYALAVEGRVHLDAAVFAHAVTPEGVLQEGSHGHDLGRRSELDSAAHVPHSVVADPWFDWGQDRPPAVPWDRMVVYEAHVRGLTMRHPDVPAELRGTYGGLAHPAVVEHLLGLGVTTLELLPVHAFVDELHLLRKGLSNYWGYSTLGFLAPHAGYARGRGGTQVAEFKAMVKTLHEAGLEVVLDVVYNHTAEGGQDGPTLSWRGIDALAYYRLDASGRDVDHTGCGNTVDLRSAPARALVLDSLRYWVRECHVDGFRFDLAPALARESEAFDPAGTFLTEVGADPVLAGVKLVAEPWDIGPDGWQTGRFPQPWAEWNDHFRDDVRDFWRGWSHGVRSVATRLLGSSDVFGDRAPLASVNLVTAHDGFTLHDLVTYDHKHNGANGEQGRDGSDNNRSWNHGAEGVTGDAEILDARQQTLRNLLATLLLAQGVPMLTAGDELGRTQRGNNNAYCQDNELSWLDWDLEPWQQELLGFVRRVLSLRSRIPALRRPTAYAGRARVGRQGRRDAIWLRPDGRPMTEHDWHDPALRTVLVRLESADEGEGTGTVLVVLHAGAEPTWVVLTTEDPAYDLVLDTRAEAVTAPGDTSAYRFGPGARVEVAPRSMVVLAAAAP